jgi:putative nucleotidyltransferase with HDIG domain
MAAKRSTFIPYADMVALTPSGEVSFVDMERIFESCRELSCLKDCPQDAIWHAEGDVRTHTMMVLRELTKDPGWETLAPERQCLLFWAAVLHDVGKPDTTVHEPNNRISSKGHSPMGAKIARRLLRAAGAPFEFREEICGLIVAHQRPFWLYKKENAVRQAIETSWLCDTDLVLRHARADGRGRISHSDDNIVEQVDLSEVVFDDIGAMGCRYQFANDHSRVEYFAKTDRDPAHAAFEDYRCTATMMSGLPGSGKDTWITQNAADQPVVSLDDIRAEMGVKSTDNQGRVAQEARERIRVHLRAGQDFIWNATNITAQMRAPLLSLFRDYGARTRIAYVEVDPCENNRQNRGRQDAIPQDILNRLARKLEPPREVEAHEIIWSVPK